MSFDILGKDIAVLFILAVIFGVATYFYVLHKGKKERRTVSTENKIILGFEVLAFSFTFFIFFPLVVEDVFDANGSNSALWHNFAAIISYGGAAFYLFCGQISGDYFTIQKFLKKHKKHKARAQKKKMETEKISRKHSVHVATCTVCGGKRVIHNSVLNARVRSINARVRFLCIFMYLLLIFCEEERQ